MSTGSLHILEPSGWSIDDACQILSESRVIQDAGVQKSGDVRYHYLLKAEVRVALWKTIF